MDNRYFFAELKRRNVYKVAIAYIVAGWALSQGIAQVFPVFDIPNWVIRLIVLLIIIGLPIALVLAWICPPIMLILVMRGTVKRDTANIFCIVCLVIGVIAIGTGIVTAVQCHMAGNDLDHLKASLPSLALVVDDAQMRGLNADWRGIRRRTDVLAFPLETPGEASPLVGQIVISADAAARQARRLGVSLAVEFELLATHGTLHLVGWDDRDPVEAYLMHRRERQILGRTPARLWAGLLAP